MRGVRRQNFSSELDVVSYRESDYKKIQRIKIAMLDAYDMLVEQDAANDTRLRKRGRPLAPPSLARILKAMPFWVNERLATELRRQLIESGDIKEIRKASPHAQANGLSRMKDLVCLDEVIASRDLERKRALTEMGMLEDTSDAERDVMAYCADLQRRGMTVYAGSKVGPVTPKSAARWAIKRYDEAWSAIQGIHLKAMMAKLAKAIEHLELPNHEQSDENFGEFGPDPENGRHDG